MFTHAASFAPCEIAGKHDRGEPAMADTDAGGCRTVTRIDLAVPRGTFRALTFGDPAARPLLWLHGFPDHPPTAESFLSILARHRYVVAPWLRGYAPSVTTGPYDLETLALDALAMIAYAVCAMAPDRVRRAVTLAVPHPLTFVRALATPRQLARSWYMGLFQLPYAERLVRARDFALIDTLWRRWSPRYQLPADRRRDLHACLAASLPGPLGYYRALVSAPWQLRRLAGPPLATPILQLHGAEDGCVAPPTTRDAKRFGKRELTIVSGAGHFLHLEQPASVAGRVMTWLS
jgi:pimeloyl-ACP methyl ester carboxylesterase